MRTIHETAGPGVKVCERPASCFGDRATGARIELVVIHYTAMENAEAALERLCGSEFEVSAHYLVGRDGTVFRMVPEDKRAWHAGAGSWAGRGDVNSVPSGSNSTMTACRNLPNRSWRSWKFCLADILDRHALLPWAVIGHSDMAPDRKRDPGRHFDWRRLAEKGLSVWPAPLPGGDFLRDAAVFGYPVHAGESAVLSAFRQRFNPNASGPLSKDDKSLMAGLAREFPTLPTVGFPGIENSDYFVWRRSRNSCDWRVSMKGPSSQCRRKCVPASPANSRCRPRISSPQCVRRTEPCALDCAS